MGRQAGIKLVALAVVTALLAMVLPLGIACDDEDEETIEAQFTASTTSGITPLEVQFTDASSNGPTGWQWDFDNDGSVDSTGQNPLHTFADPGTFTVVLTASNAVGQHTSVKEAYITVLDSGSVFRDGFESGTTAAWSGSVGE